MPHHKSTKNTDKNTDLENKIKFGRVGVVHNFVLPKSTDKRILDLWYGGFTLMEKKKYNEAMRDFEKALTFEPNNPDILNNMGLCLSQMKNYLESIRCYEHALIIASKNPVIISNIGQSWAKLGEYDKAITYYDNALTIDPNYQTPLYNKACSYAMKGETTAALELLGRLIQQNPDWKIKATSDEDFFNLRDSDVFKIIIS